MKNQLLINFTSILFRKTSFRMAAFAVLTLLCVQSSFAQTPFTWTGGTSTDFLTSSNWTSTNLSTPTFVAADGFIIPSASITNFPVLNTDGTITALSCTNIILNASGSTLTTNIPVTCSAATANTFVATGATLSTNANYGCNTGTSYSANGNININAGTFTARLYIGNSVSSAATIGVATGATLFGVGVWKISVDASPTTPGTLNVNGGTYEMTTGSSLTIGGTSAARKGILNVNSGLVKFTGTATLSLGNAGTTTTGTVNLAGGSLEYNAVNLSNGGIINITGGSFKLLNTAPTINAANTSTSGVINIAGGTLDTSGPLTIGHTVTTTALVTVNVNSGTMNIAGALNISTPTGVYTGLINIDAGSIVLTGDQTAGIAALIAANRIKTSGAALAAGKIISNTYNAGTGKTTVVAVDATTTWNGLAWSNSTPTSSVEAIIEGVYSTGTNGTFTTKKLTVNSGSLTINSGTSVTVQNEVINNAGANGIVVENNANLIQVNNTTNTGNIVVNRNSNALSRLDYTLWSSPVAGQNLAAFSPLTSQSPNRFYTYDTANNQYSNAFDPTSTNFAVGTGYLIRMPNTAVAFPATETFAGQFTGVPNNGDISIALLTSDSTYNLVGNPYPSTINLYTLQSNNSTVIGNTFYMWRTTNAAGTAYCTYVPTNTTTGTYVSNAKPQSPVTFVGDIQPGQAFFVTALTTGPLVFKNAQRVTTSTSFFKTKQVAAADKVWLNATNAAGDFSQMAVTYFDGATSGVDAFDGKYINDSPLALTSNINNEEYTIQGRPGFDASDVVPLNFKTAVAGDYTIAIDHSEGVFATGQSVILADAATGTETDLTTSSYTFTATIGAANSRFSLKYQKTLGTNKAVFSDNNVAVYRSKGTLYVNAGDTTIANIKVYDVQGKLVTELKNGKATSASIANLKATNQVLVVKITSQENKVVTKKVVN